MEEADTLCTLIGIVAKGELKCLGTQAHLKARFGDGFKVILNLDHSFSLSPELAVAEAKTPVVQVAIGSVDGNAARASDRELDAFVRSKLCADAKLANAVGKNVIYALPKDSVGTEASLSIFTAMERNQKLMKDRFGIVEWGITQSSLEEVFMNIVGRADEATDE